MTENKSISLDASQRELAKISNHRVWDLLDKPDRSPGESEEMLQAAYASLYHWTKVGTGVHIQRAYWLLTKVYISLGKASDAVDQAVKCQELTEKHPGEMKDFDLAYAQEALARAYALSGDLERAKDHFETTEKLGHAIKDNEDRTIFQADLISGDWYGIK